MTSLFGLARRRLPGQEGCLAKKAAWPRRLPGQEDWLAKWRLLGAGPKGGQLETFGRGRQRLASAPS